VGSGPAGLAAAITLHKLGVSGIQVIDREREAGGMPRLCYHTGFGWHDLRRIQSGPNYARLYRKRAADAGIVVQTSTMVTGWSGLRTVALTSPMGRREIGAEAILLATGCRERPGAARLVPGNRPLGLFTTGALQRFLHEQGQVVGRRAVIVGAELISLSALLTLAGAGIEVAAMLTPYPHHQVYSPYSPLLWYANRRYGVKLVTGAQVSQIHGRRRVEAVEYCRVATGERMTLACDTIIFSGQWIPEHELARTGGLTLNPATLGPEVDLGLRSSVPGIFAAGNLLRGAQTADYAALEGQLAAQSIAQYLRDAAWPQRGVPIEVEAPLAWISPNRISAAPTASKNAFVFQVGESCRNVQLSVYQGSCLLARQSFGRLIPNCSYPLKAHWLSAVDREGEALRLVLA
jgi:thioredoxin reductase